MITGGTGALGRAVAEHFLANGAKVAVPWIVEAEVPLFNQQMGGRFPEANMMLARVDLASEQEVGKFVADATKRFGQLDILINLVGGFWGFKTVAETTSAEWQAMFDLNLKPTFLCCRAAVPIMQKNKYGRIVSVSSRTGLIAPSTIDTEANRKAMPKAKHENWVKPADIARTLAFLCSDQNQVTSGVVVPVYGRA
jgi:NAD(P)-dependent dehydrogenase (short-subunit alcohol dehydrogenase family)